MSGPKVNKSSIAIAPGLRGGIRISPLTGCDYATYSPYFGASPIRGPLKPFLISKHGYEGAFQAALAYYVQSRGLSEDAIQELQKKLPARSEFIALRSILARSTGYASNEREFLRELFSEPSGSPQSSTTSSPPNFDDPDSWFI